MPTPPELPSFVRDFAASVLLLVRELDAARLVQYEDSASRSRRTATDYDDPTGEIAADANRLVLRAAVVDAELSLSAAQARVTDARAALAAAFARFDGSPREPEAYLLQPLPPKHAQL